MRLSLALSIATTGGQITETLSVPTGFDLSPSYSLTRTSSGAYSTNFDITTLIPAITVTYYVDPINGNNGNAGTTSGAPLKDLSAAIAKADVDQIRIINLTDDFVARSTIAWNGTQPTRSMSIINTTAYRFVSAFASGTLPTFTAHGSYANVYQSTTTAPSKMVDIASKTQPVHPITGASITTVPPIFLTMTNVASPEAVRDLAGSWHHDGTILYVRLFDNRTAIGDIKLIKCLGGNNGRMGNTDNITIYVDKVDFVGGTSFNCATSTSTFDPTLAMINCSFQASDTSVSANGLAVKGKVTCYLKNCGAYYNAADGFNYHSFAGDGTDDVNSPTFFEDGCVSVGSGTTGSAGTSDNASTAHEGADGIRLNCVYVNSDDRVLVDINFAETWNLGCVVGPSVKTGAGSELVVTQNSAQMWMDGCLVATGDSDRFLAGSGSFIRYRNMGDVTNAGAGTVEAY